MYQGHDTQEWNVEVFHGSVYWTVHHQPSVWAQLYLRLVAALTNPPDSLYTTKLHWRVYERLWKLQTSKKKILKKSPLVHYSPVQKSHVFHLIIIGVHGCSCWLYSQQGTRLFLWLLHHSLPVSRRIVGQDNGEWSDSCHHLCWLVLPEDRCYPGGGLCLPLQQVLLNSHIYKRFMFSGYVDNTCSTYNAVVFIIHNTVCTVKRSPSPTHPHVRANCHVIMIA